MEYVLTIDPTNCNGCRICESVCALFHEQECNPEKSRIRILVSEEEAEEAGIRLQRAHLDKFLEILRTATIMPTLGYRHV